MNLEDVAAGHDINIADTIIERQIVVSTYAPPVVTLRAKLDATLYTEATVAGKHCKAFFGRQDELAQIEKRLDTSNEVLLCGLGGSGKTALAATLADRRLRAGKGPVVWLHCGSEDATAQLEAFARLAGRLGFSETEKTIKSLVDEAQLQAVHDFLAQLHVAMLVLDDVRDGEALKVVLSTVPATARVLITSRHHYAVDEIVELGNLTPNVALDLLCYHADKKYHDDPSATALCERLGYHAYAIEIAGSKLKVDKRTPRQLLERIRNTPHAITMPEGFAEVGRSSVKALLDESLRELDTETRAVFLAFGALFAPGATVELLAACLRRDLLSVEDALDALARRSLVTRDEGVSFYRMHDLTFAYVRALFKENQENYQTTVAGVESYVLAYAHDFDLLDLDQINILSTTAIAPNEHRLRIISTLVIGDFPAPCLPSYFDIRGHTLEMLTLLDAVILNIKKSLPDNSSTLHYLLGKRGNAHVDRAELEEALSAYQEALASAPNNPMRIRSTAACGRVLAQLKRFDDSAKYFEQAGRLALEDSDDSSLAFLLEQQSYVAGELKEDYTAARRYASEAVEVNRRLNTPIRLGFSLINLGLAEMFLGVSTAIKLHNEVLEIAHDEGHEELRAGALEALARDYHALMRFAETQDYFGQALRLCKQLGKADQAHQLRSIIETYGYQIDGNAP